MNSSPIFIMSSERSGSNLLRSLLSNHTNLAAPIAPHMLESFWTISKYYQPLSAKRNAIRLIDDVLLLVNHPYHDWRLHSNPEVIYKKYTIKSFLDVFDAIYMEYTLSRNKLRFVCKENALYLYLLPLIKYYIDPVIIYLVRDPRDYVVSWMNLRFMYPTPYQAIKQWVYEQDLAYELMNRHCFNIYCVRYEDLISDTATTMANILRFIHEKVDISCFELNTKSAEEVKWNPFWSNLSKPIVKDNYRKYRKALSGTQLNIIESLAKSHMIRYNYECETDANWSVSRIFLAIDKINGYLIRNYNIKRYSTELHLLFQKKGLVDTIRLRAQSYGD